MLQSISIHVGYDNQREQGVIHACRYIFGKDTLQSSPGFSFLRATPDIRSWLDYNKALSVYPIAVRHLRVHVTSVTGIVFLEFDHRN